MVGEPRWRRFCNARPFSLENQRVPIALLLAPRLRGLVPGRAIPRHQQGRVLKNYVPRAVALLGYNKVPSETPVALNSFKPIQPNADCLVGDHRSKNTVHAKRN